MWGNPLNVHFYPIQGQKTKPRKKKKKKHVERVKRPSSYGCCAIFARDYRMPSMSCPEQ